MSNLGRRVVTASILIPLVVGLVELAPTNVVALLFAAILLGGAWEWSAFSGSESLALRISYVGLTAGLLLGAYLTFAGVVAGLAYAVGGLLWWSLALYWVIDYQRQGTAANTAFVRAATPRVTLVCGWLVLIPAWATLVVMHSAFESGPRLVLGLLVLIWSADIGAYFAGRQWGKRRLADRVSPGKTWEGVAGGAVAGVVVAVSLGFSLDPTANPLIWGLVGVATVGISVLGDLSESLFKRHAGVKDSSGLLPGHGGILDRVDSLTAAAPLFLVAGWWLLTESPLRIS